MQTEPLCFLGFCAALLSGLARVCRPQAAARRRVGAQAVERRRLLHRRHARRRAGRRPDADQTSASTRTASWCRSSRAKQTILQPEVAAIHYTLLLVDMSGSVVDRGTCRRSIQAAASFAERVGPYQKVAVYTFDGSPHITPLVGFGGNVRGGIDGARDAPAARSVDQPQRRGHRGRARADAADGARAACRCASARWWSSPTAPTARTARRPRTSARRSTAPASRPTSSAWGRRSIAAQLVAHRAVGHVRVEEPRRHPEAASTRSPRASRRRRSATTCCRTARRRARATHEVEVEADAHGPLGPPVAISSMPTGFGPNCDPNQRPAFDVRHPRAIPPDAVAPPVAERHPANAPPPPSSGDAPAWQPKR